MEIPRYPEPHAYDCIVRPHYEERLLRDLLQQHDCFTPILLVVYFQYHGGEGPRGTYILRDGQSIDFDSEASWIRDPANEAPRLAAWLESGGVCSIGSVARGGVYGLLVENPYLEPKDTPFWTRHYLPYAEQEFQAYADRFLDSMKPPCVKEVHSFPGRLDDLVAKVRRRYRVEVLEGAPPALRIHPLK